MGGLHNKDNIKDPAPGQILLNTGIPDFDRVFNKCERPLSVLINCRIDLDLRTTQFIKSLGVTRYWDRSKDLREIIQMMLVVLSGASNGDFSLIEVFYSQETPYLHVNERKLNRATKRLVQNYYYLVEYMAKIPNKLHKVEPKIKKCSLKCKEFVQEVLRKAEELDFPLTDKIKTIKNTNLNHAILAKAPRELTQLIHIVDEAREKVSEACQRAQQSPYSDILIIQGVQARTERLIDPKLIVRRFWPTSS